MTGIYLEEGDLTIQGDSSGSLDMTVKNHEYSTNSYTRNIYTKAGSLNLESGRIVFKTQNAKSGQNLSVYGDLHIGEAAVNIQNTTQLYSIFYKDRMTVSEEAEVTITGGQYAINPGEAWFYIGAKRYGLENFLDIKSLTIENGTATDMTDSSNPIELTNKNVDTLYVNGEDILSAPNYTVQCGEGTATYDITSNTLMLKDATIDTGHEENSTAYGIYAKGDAGADKLNIRLSGTNTFSGVANAILVEGGSQGTLICRSQNQLVIEKGVTLDLEVCSLGMDIDREGIENNGIVKLTDENIIVNLGLTGSGVVQVSGSDGKNVYYNNSGKEINAVLSNIEVKVGTADEASENKGYTWEDVNGVWTLTLDNAYVDGSVEITANQDDKIAIHTTGENVITGSTGVGDGDYYKGILLTGSSGSSCPSGVSLTFTGDGTLTVQNGNVSMEGGNDNVLTVAQGATVNLEQGRVAVGASGGVDGRVEVNGKLDIDAGNEFSAIYGGQVEIGSSGTLNVSGETGLFLQGMLDEDSHNAFANSFVVKAGGKFKADCTGPAIHITDGTGGGDWPSDPNQVIVLPDGYLPSDAKVAICQQQGSPSVNHCSITNSTLTYDDTSRRLQGALSGLTISVDNVPKPEPEPEPDPSSHSDSGDTTYAIIVQDADNGSVAVSNKRASRNQIITLTVQPDDGYVLDVLNVIDRNGLVRVTEKGDGRYIFSMPSSTVTIAATFVEEPEPVQPVMTYENCTHDAQCPLSVFTDVDTQAWYHDGIHYCLDEGLMAGTGADTFSPDVAATRGMVVTILARLDGVDTSTGDTWYEAGRQWAMANGISDGADMEEVITREQLATMLWRYAGSPSASADLSGYTDAGMVSSWAQQAMAWCVEQGIISGTTTTTLSPQGPATRAQVATILMRFIEGNQ